VQTVKESGGDFILLRCTAPLPGRRYQTKCNAAPLKWGHGLCLRDRCWCSIQQAQTAVVARKSGRLYAAAWFWFADAFKGRSQDAFGSPD